MTISFHRLLGSTAVASTLALAGCGDSGQASSPPQPPEVSVVSVEAKPRHVVRELPGRIAPTRVSEVRARVSGIVMRRLFEQGSDVTEGDPLYQIDPRPFEVELQAAEAALAKANAVLDQTTLHAKRIELLLGSNTASRAQHELAVANLRQAQADVAGRQADVARAKLNIEYATIRAPISGRIGAALVTEGALVGQGEATRVATIQQLDTVYADFTQSVSELNRLRREIESGSLEKVAADTMQAELELDEDEVYPLPGRLLFSDATVDPTTGQVRLRAEFKNPKLDLLPGMYVRVRITVGVDSDAIAVPQQSVQWNGDGGSAVYLVSADNRVSRHPVKVGDTGDDGWVVLDGLKPSDQIVVEGFQRFVPGQVVNPRPLHDALIKIPDQRDPSRAQPVSASTNRGG